MANITTGHDTTSTVTAPTKKVTKKQTPIWVFALAAPLSLLLLGGGIRLATEIQDGIGNMGGTAVIFDR